MVETDCACNIQVLPDDKAPLYKANRTVLLDGLQHRDMCSDR